MIIICLIFHSILISKVVHSLLHLISLCYVKIRETIAIGRMAKNVTTCFGTDLKRSLGNGRDFLKMPRP